MGRFIRFSIQDKFNYFIILMEKYGYSFEKAVDMVGFDLGQMIIAHDNYLPAHKQIDRLNRGNKTYQYVGNGHFRRVNKNGSFCIDGKSKIVDGAKRIGFVDNPLKYALMNGKEKK